ncbi:hypothetical protein GPALN_012114 [Globodera pallida]|nr:hypothetical protein GPALN_012114 [Globodera pallida]
MLNKTFHETVNPPKNTLRQSPTSKSQVPAIRPSNWNLLSTETTETKWGKGVILLNEQDLDCLETVTRWFLNTITRQNWTPMD